MFKRISNDLVRDVGLHSSEEMTRESLAKIGSYFGGIRPSAVSLACRRIAARLEEDGEFTRRVEELAQRIEA